MRHLATAGRPTFDDLPAAYRAALAVRELRSARGEVPAGYKVAPHSHPNDENVTVISGMFHLGIGEKFDESKGQAIKPGGYAQTPKGVKHYAWSSQETVIQLHGVGPGGFTYVNLADDPRKK